MSSSGRFSVATAGAFVLGGLAALVLATVIALGGYGRSEPATGTPAHGASGAGSELPGEYLLDVSDVKDEAQLPP